MCFKSGSAGSYGSKTLVSDIYISLLTCAAFMMPKEIPKQCHDFAATTMFWAKMLGPPNPRKLAEMKFWLSNHKSLVTRHGVINWEEFGEKFGASSCTVNEARRCPENFAQVFAQYLALTCAQLLKSYRRNFALGNVCCKRCPWKSQNHKCQLFRIKTKNRI